MIWLDTDKICDSNIFKEILYKYQEKESLYNQQIEINRPKFQEKIINYNLFIANPLHSTSKDFENELI